MTPRGSFFADLIGVRKKGDIPNIADRDSRTSVAISRHLLVALGLDDNHEAPESQAAGRIMETLIADDLRNRLGMLAPERSWLVERPGRRLSRFAQYEHLAVLQRLVDNDATLRVAIGREYEVAPDITIGLSLPEGHAAGGPDDLPLLHASVSCKLTIRSDRVQNIRQEGAVLARQRRGRMPHVVAVTMEPLPSRLASIARGTGDVDAIYHPALPELRAAVREVGTSAQRDVLDELVGQRRLLDYHDLAPTLAIV